MTETPRQSTGARYGQQRVSQRLANAPRGDPRTRRSANAERTSAGIGDGAQLDELGRIAVDREALRELIREEIDQ